ncbi:hypothetical protein Kpho02_40660 [Kitasatospora phosalacinea]|uniref:Secreted protein n=1 Tax=Kitasatospora phosalacinea TaxID=2065 RepID=A0A9W6Q829_9ACTN|nr:hypothetical protein [Kitasatospora phosalacinea]GLW71767.1 hypothetical protein Kpho02_40660 [Kitasatospora phosalacinea]
MRRARTLGAAALAVCAVTGLGAGPAAAADGVALPYPGPDGLVWVNDRVGDGGLVSGGAWASLPTVLTVACEGGGTVRVTMRTEQAEVAAFTVDCPVGTTGLGSVTLAPGVVQGSFSVYVDAGGAPLGWALQVVQPE